jgi:hypothetical protein
VCRQPDIGLEPTVLEPQPEALHRAVHHLAQIERLLVQRLLAGLEPGEVEDVVDELHEPIGLARDRAQVLVALLGRAEATHLDRVDGQLDDRDRRLSSCVTFETKLVLAFTRSTWRTM